MLKVLKTDYLNVQFHVDCGRLGVFPLDVCVVLLDQHQEDCPQNVYILLCEVEIRLCKLWHHFLNCDQIVK